MTEDRLRSALALQPRPRLSPFFSARIVARLPKHVRRSVLALYWAVTGAIAVYILSIHRFHLPSWMPIVLLALVPITLCIALVVPSPKLRRRE